MSATNGKGRKAAAGNGKLPGNLAVSLVPQPNGGALLSGGKPGHKGAGGRPKDELRALMRGKLDAVLASLAKKHAAGELSPADELRYADFLAKYGIGTQQESEGSQHHTHEVFVWRVGDKEIPFR